MKHIRTWRERVNEGDSIYAKATALEAEVAELRTFANQLAGLLAALHYKQYNTDRDATLLRRNIERSLKDYDIGEGKFR